jgi:hypothetical protein
MRGIPIILDIMIQTGHHSPDEHPLAGYDHLADTKTLNVSKIHYHKTRTDFGFAVKQRQTEVKSEYRKKAGNSMQNITSLVMRRRSSPF